MNRLCELLNIELPLIQSPMAGVQGSDLAISVSNAGGLGSLPGAMLNMKAIRSELSKIKESTSKPFSVNFFCHSMPEFDSQKESAWQATLLPFYKELNIDLSKIDSSLARLPFSQETIDNIREFAPPVVSFHFGLPEEKLLRQVKDWGAKILSSATTIDEALWLESNGADAIIAQGIEAGGHRGMFLTNDLRTQKPLKDLVKELVKVVQKPIIAAGGISSKDQINHLMDLGAMAVQIGAAFLLCPETSISNIHKHALCSDEFTETCITNIFTGRPARSLVNRIVKEIGPINSKAPEFPLAANAIFPLRVTAEGLGRSDFSALWAGVGYKSCQSDNAAGIIRKLFS